jgi:hypothetical protein
MIGISQSVGLDIIHRLDPFMETKLGCYIDCSHLSSDDLNYRIIQFAHEVFEWDGGVHDIVLLMNDYVNGVPEDEEWVRGFMSTEELSETLYFAADDAVQWLNDQLTTGNCYWTIEDNSLYLEEQQDDEV